MSLYEMVIRSKLIPPQPQKAIFQRSRLHQWLAESHQYPLTLIHAGTGFGKTTALMELGGLFNRVFWFNISEPDRDPTLFLAHLIAAFFPLSQAVFDRFEQDGISASTSLLNALINQLTVDLEEDSILILDDFHLTSNINEINQWLEQLVDHRPPHLHIAIACRQIPDSAAFIRWRVKGHVCVVDQSQLSFTQEEIYDLFHNHYQFGITQEQASALYQYTDGWIIALQMIWQRLQTSRSKNLNNILAELPKALSDTFNFLAQEVLMRQTERVQHFLLASAILNQMDADVCNAIMGIDDSAEMLQLLHEKGLFITNADHVHYRYQRLFQDFLLNYASQHDIPIIALHQKSTRYYISIHHYEEAVYHCFSSGDFDEAATLIELTGKAMLESGRLRTLTRWIEKLHEKQLEAHPAINLLMGDVLRFRSKFEDAITCYNQAERVYINKKDAVGRSLALRSKAQVYLDTVRPLRASSLLEEAIRLLEPQEHPLEMATLLDLLAENKLNQGKPAEAHTLHQEANMLRSESVPDDIYLEARTLLRTGRLHEGRALIENAGVLDEAPATQRPQRFHREMTLLLSLICLMLGEREKGEAYARLGIEIGHQLDSPFVEAVGLMRLGHAHQLNPQVAWRKNQLAAARACYEKAIELVKPFNVMRVQVEPLWGLCRYYGYQGNLTEARRYAEQALEISENAGDFWFVALLKTTMGTACTLAGEYEAAQNWLQAADGVFHQVGDVFGQCACQCALMLKEWLSGDVDAAMSRFAATAPKLKTHNFSFLLVSSSHLGIQDDQVFYPLLIEALSRKLETDWVTMILWEKQLEGVDYHPGYGLAVRCLGTFETWRGNTLVSARDWQREKARQLFQFFINNRGRWYSKEQIADRLWQDLDVETTSQNFKVALNALNRALEPDRPAGKTPFFIAKRDNTYGINPSAAIMLDVDDFITLSNGNDEKDLLESLTIHQGDYLPDLLDDHGTIENREQYRDRHLSTMLRLAELYFSKDRWDEAVKISHDILTIDACHEPAFRMLMQCHAARGSRAAAQAVYQRCCNILREDLDVAPSEETVKLWQMISKTNGS